MDIINTIVNTRLWNKYGIQAVWAFAILCLLLSISLIGWTFHTQKKIKTKNYAAQKIKPISKAAGPSYNINDIVKANLFGDPKPKVVKVKKAPKTTLDLTLQGILSATDQNLARAIIMTGKKKSGLYSVGEKIVGAGASVKEIKAGEVLLDRNGATESLPLLKKKASGNRQIISFSGGESDGASAGTATASRRSTGAPVNSVASNNSSKKVKPRSRNGAPRKIRKPNFSGLDKALKKMGEI